MSRKALVLDANILIRAVLGQKVRSLIIEYSNSVDWFTPSICFDDAYHYLPELFRKRGLEVEPALHVLDHLKQVIQPIETEWLASVEVQARLRMKQRDEQDWPILAAALVLNCPIWTEDADFFGVGVATWTTNTIQHYLAE